MNRFVKLLALALLCSSVAAGSVHAADQQLVTLDFAAAFEPAGAIGFLVDPKRTVQKPNASIEKIDGATYRVSFPYEDSEISENTLATAMISLANNEVIFTNLQPFTPGTGGLQAPSILPICTPDTSGSKKIEGLEGNYQALVNVRKQRRDLAKQKLALRINDELRTKLGKLEEGFGLKHPQTISSDLEPLEVLDRLARIKAAIQEYSYYKKQRKTEQK